MVKNMVILLILLLVTVYSDQIVTTSDGKKVILLNNGKWRSATPLEIKKYSTDGKLAGSDNDSSATDSISAKIKKDGTPDKGSAKKGASLVDVVKSDTSYDFRKFRWGMEKNHIKANEKGKIIKDDNNLLEYEVEHMGFNCKVIYIFENNKLQKTGLKILQDHIDPAKYYNDYEELKKYLSPIYGTPVTDKYEWKNSLYKEDQSKRGFAVSIGFLTCRTVWKNNRTQVTLNISGGNHQIATNLEYSPSE